MADYSLNNVAEAITSFSHAIQLNPDESIFYNNLAAAYAHEGHVQSALVILDEEEPANLSREHGLTVRKERIP